MGSVSLTVEDVLDRCSALPLETRRSMELLHSLDLRWSKSLTELRKLHEAYLKQVRTRIEKLPRDGSVDLRKATAAPEALARIEALRAEVQQVGELKFTVAQQAHDTIKAASEKLALDLRRFEAELRSSGDLVDEREVNYAESSEAEDDASESGGYGRSGQRHGGGRAPKQPRWNAPAGGAPLPSASRYAPPAGSPMVGGAGGFAWSGEGGGDGVHPGEGGVGSGSLLAQQQALSLASAAVHQYAQQQQSQFGGDGGSDRRGAGEEAMEEDASGGGGEDDTTPYCTCRKPAYGEMVGCDSDACPFGEWFHLACVGLAHAPKGTWHCPQCAREQLSAGGGYNPQQQLQMHAHKAAVGAAAAQRRRA